MPEVRAKVASVTLRIETGVHHMTESEVVQR